MFNESSRYAPKMCSESFLAYLTLLFPIFHPISTPVLVVGGSDDGLISVQEFQQTAKHYEAALEIIEGGSHDLMLDADFIKTADVIHQWIIKQ